MMRLGMHSYCIRKYLKRNKIKFHDFNFFSTIYRASGYFHGRRLLLFGGGVRRSTVHFPRSTAPRSTLHVHELPGPPQNIFQVYFCNGYVCIEDVNIFYSEFNRKIVTQFLQSDPHFSDIVPVFDFKNIYTACQILGLDSKVNFYQSNVIVLPDNLNCF